MLKNRIVLYGGVYKAGGGDMEIRPPLRLFFQNVFIVDIVKLKFVMLHLIKTKCFFNDLTSLNGLCIVL